MREFSLKFFQEGEWWRKVLCGLHGFLVLYRCGMSEGGKRVCVYG